MADETSRPPAERAFFREGPDGVTVFFPWGLGHRGYRLPDDEALRARAARAPALLVAAVMAIGVWTAHALQPLLERGAGADAWLGVLGPAGGALALALLAYTVWTARFVEGLQESDLQLSREERLREAAAAVPPWHVALAGGALAAMSGLLVWLEPRALWLGLAGIALGAGLVGWSVLLRRAATRPPRQ